MGGPGRDIATGGSSHGLGAYPHHHQDGDPLRVVISDIHNYPKMGEITCVDGGSRGEIRAMREVRARREIQKRNGSSQDRPVACMREIRRAGKAVVEVSTRGRDTIWDERQRQGMAVQGSEIRGMASLARHVEPQHSRHEPPRPALATGAGISSAALLLRVLSRELKSPDGVHTGGMILVEIHVGEDAHRSRPCSGRSACKCSPRRSCCSQFDIDESGSSVWWERFDAMLRTMSEVEAEVEGGEGVERAALEVEVEGNCLDMEMRASRDFGTWGWGRQLEAQCACAGASPCFGSRTLSTQEASSAVGETGQTGKVGADEGRSFVVAGNAEGTARSAVRLVRNTIQFITGQ
ncbi:hypothetical protein B0H14DRAFT_3781732 [Mycena olivaceomarginata]|nr:hypothetical protein B0H14DRAFT_3781732 [Mycena olivaceomarginata]